MKNRAKQIAVHLVTHTHWDREWYQPVEIYRFRLIDVCERLKQILAQNPEYHSFHFDGQTVPLDDYLEARPEDREFIYRQIRAGRLRFGPFYVLHDEQLTSGESQVRNLILGMETVRAAGGSADIGYLPDNFGHVAQTPQILAGFGLDNAVIWRGYQVRDDTPSEAIWEGADGTRLKAVLLVRGYSSGAGMNATDPESFSRPFTVLAELKKRAGFGTVLLMNGIDHALPNPDIAGMIAVLEKHDPEIRVFHSSLEELIAALPWEKVRYTLKGELLHAPHLDGTFSARLELKKLNRFAETEIAAYAEPLSCMAWLDGRSASAYPTLDLKRAWKYLIRCHPHDSITGCHADRVAEDMTVRLKRSGEMANYLVNAAWDRISGEVYDYQLPDTAKVISIFNPLPLQRCSVVRTTIFLAPEIETVEGVFLRNGSSVYQATILEQDVLPIVWPQRSDFMIPKNRPCKRLTIEFGPVPLAPLTITDFQVTVAHRENPADNLMDVVKANESTASCISTRIGHAPDTLENEHLRVIVSANGSVLVTHKASGIDYAKLHILEVQQDAGNLYSYRRLQSNASYFLSPQRMAFSENHISGATLEVAGTVRLPAGIDQDFHPLREQVECPATICFTLKRGDPILYVRTTIDNRARNCCWRVRFPTGFLQSQHLAHTPFDLTRRDPLPNLGEHVSRNSHVNTTINRYCCQHFASFTDGYHGITLLNRGLPEYTFTENGEATLTLLRNSNIIWGWNSGDYPMHEFPAETGNELGIRHCEYGLLFHGSKLESWLPDAMGYNMPPRARLYREPRACRFSLELAPTTLMASALKLAEDGDGLIFRFSNPLESPQNAVITVSPKPESVWKVRMDESRGTAISIRHGKIRLRSAPKEIITIRLKYSTK
jgi:alpha-mannosidase